MQPRWYQSEAVEAVFSYLGKEGLPDLASPAVELPTGAGKSAVIAWITQRLVEEYGARVIVATHRAELIEQDAHDMREVWPQAPIGIYSASLGQRQGYKDVCIAGVQTVCRPQAIKKLGHRDIMIIDEAHCVSAEEGTQYRQLIDGLRKINPDMRIIGLSATPFRTGQGYITAGDGALFSSIVYRADVKRLVKEGHLAPLVAGVTSAEIDASEIAVRAGEFVVKDLELASNTDEVNDAVASDVAALLASGRKHALVYGVSVAHAAMMRNALRMLGVRAEMVDGSMDRVARRKIYEGFKSGEIQALCSCDVITTGFNVKPVDIVALVRPTQSTALYVQILGRGMRTAPGKVDCVVLDYGGNIARHGPVDDVRVREPRKSSGSNDAPVKNCPSCYAELPVSVRSCEHCGHEFPAPERKANKQASYLPPMGSKKVAQAKGKRTLCEVGDVMVFRHTKKGDESAPPTVRLDYYEADESKSVPAKIASEWLCFEHKPDSFPYRKACSWWDENVGTYYPKTVDEAVQRLRTKEFPRVRKVLVEPDGEFTRVVELFQDQPRQPGEDDVPDDEPAPEYNDGFFDDDLPF